MLTFLQGFVQVAGGLIKMMNDYKTLTYWNQNTYGKAIRIKKDHFRFAMLIFCIVTPFTNWMIPFLKRIIKNDFIIRFNTRKGVSIK